MKLGIEILSFGCFVLTSELFGFGSANILNHDSVIQNTNLAVKQKSISQPAPSKSTSIYMPVAWLNIESGSNGVPLSMINRFAFGGYVSPSEMNDYQQLLSASGNRMGAIQNYGINIYPIIGIPVAKKLALENITLEIDDITGANFNQDAFRLIFQGNTNYLGQTLNVGNNVVESWRTRTFKFHFRKTFPKWEIIPTIQFGQCLNYTRIETQDIQLKSDALGDEITFKGNAYSANSGYSFLGNGVGMQADLVFSIKNIYQNQKNAFGLSFGIKNFGFYNISDVNVMSRNAVWNADQSNILPEGWNQTDPFKLQAVQISSSDLQFGTWFNRQGDSIKSKLNFVESKRRGNVLAPFTLFAKLNITNHTYVSSIKRQEILLKYVNVIGYLPQLSYWAYLKQDFRTIKGNTKFVLNYMLGLSVGGFDDVNFNVGFSSSRLKLKNQSLLVTAKFTGIEAYFNPSNWHGAGIQLEVFYPLYQGM
jgi:hypothetical protein